MCGMAGFCEVGDVKFLFAHQNLGQFGGAETNVQLAAEELGRRGFQIDLLYRERTGRGEASWERVFQGLYQLPTTGKAEWVKNILDRAEPDLIYLHNLSDLEVVEGLFRSGIPVIRMIHDHSLYCMRTYKYNYFTRNICTRAASGYCVVPCLASVGRNPQGKLPIKWVSYARRRKELQLTYKSERLVVYSEYQKEELVRNGFDRSKIAICVPIRMLENGPNERSPIRKNLVLYTGQLVRGKGVDVLLRALAQVRTQFECMILGDGNHRAHCERLCQKLGLENRVRFRGYVAPSESQSLYQQASVFVMSSLWPEPFGMAGPEAMRYGIPVVAFDAGGVREWLIDGHNGYLAPWKDAAGLASRIERLLNDKAQASLLGRRAAEWVSQYDSVRQIDCLQRLFEEVLQGRAASRSTKRLTEIDPICL